GEVGGGGEELLRCAGHDHRPDAVVVAGVVDGAAEPLEELVVVAVCRGPVEHDDADAPFSLQPDGHGLFLRCCCKLTDAPGARRIIVTYVKMHDERGRMCNRPESSGGE